jgi:acetyl esterase/lipase
MRRLSEEEELKGLPPLLFVHGTQDLLYNQIQKEVETLKERGIGAALISVSGAGHDHRAAWSEMIFDWMKESSYS